LTPIKGLRRFAAAPARVYRRFCDEFAELEKRHQALEQEINECLTHPAVDDLRIVELKRRKLLVKDEIERLRHNGQASVH
jgi:hypothetical protein